MHEHIVHRKRLQDGFRRAAEHEKWVSCVDVAQKHTNKFCRNGGTTVARRWQVVASGGKWWQMVASGGRWWQMVGCPAECGWPVSVPFRKLKESERVRQPIQHALHPGKRGRRIAPRIPPNRPRMLVGWWFGSLVCWLSGSALPSQVWQ